MHHNPLLIWVKKCPSIPTSSTLTAQPWAINYPQQRAQDWCCHMHSKACCPQRPSFGSAFSQNCVFGCVLHNKLHGNDCTVHKLAPTAALFPKSSVKSWGPNDEKSIWSGWITEKGGPQIMGRICSKKPCARVKMWWNIGTESSAWISLDAQGFLVCT